MQVFIALARDALGNPPLIALKFYNGLILLALSCAMKWQPLEGAYAVFQLQGFVEGFSMESWYYAAVTFPTALGLLCTRPSSRMSRYALLGASFVYVSLAIAFGFSRSFTGTATYSVLCLVALTASAHTPSI
jgi:hypothetical protein